MATGQVYLFAIFLFSTGLVLAALWFFTSGDRRLEARLSQLASGERPPPEHDPVVHLARAALPKVAEPLLPGSEQLRTRLQARLYSAGYYAPQAMTVYLACKMLLIFTPWLVGLTIGLAGLLPIKTGVAMGAIVGATGLIGPELWLRRCKEERHRSMRAGLPDVLDVLVICLEAGASLTAGLRRIVGELRGTHPLLAAELLIAQREVDLGLPTGEALHHLASRADLEEMYSLAGVVLQAERLGSGLVKALRIHAETLRQKRLQEAEETASKAATKVLFPTLLCIFPGILVLLVGPAAIQVKDLLDRLKANRAANVRVETKI